MLEDNFSWKLREKIRLLQAPGIVEIHDAISEYRKLGKYLPLETKILICLFVCFESENERAREREHRHVSVQMQGGTEAEA